MLEEEEEEHIIRRQEAELVRWYADVHVHMDNDQRVPSRCEYGMIHIVDELSYWEERLVDLEFITNILKRARVSEIVEHLRKAQSGFVKLYDSMTNSLEAIFDRPWLLTCSLTKQLQEAYSSYSDLYQRILKNSFRAWWNQIDPKIENQLETHIFTKNQLSNHCWKFNFDLKSHIYDLTDEIVCWKLIKVEMPYEYLEFTKIAKNIRILHKNATMILKDYNYIIAGLSKQEVQLFYEKINTCVKIIDPLVLKYTWSQSDNMMLYWDHYLIKIDTLIHESLVLNVRWSMKNTLTQRTETVFLINVSLHGNKIKYNPSLIQLVVYSMKLLLDMTTALKVIPRLCHTFKIANVNLMPYSYAITHDKVCSDLQTEIDITTKDILVHLNIYMNTLMKYSDIWTKDKLEQLNEFESIPHNADSIDKQIIMYLNYINKFNEMETETTVSCTIVNISDMIKQIVKHCQDWISNYSLLLLGETVHLIEEFYEYIEMNGERVMLPPVNLDEMVQFIEYKKKVDLECDAKKEDINLITENVVILDKHEIQMSDELRRLYDNLHNSWNNYTILLNEADLMLKEKQEEFHEMVLHDQEIFKQNIEDFKKIWEEFKETESKNVELTSSDALNHMSLMEEKYQKIKTEEKQLKHNLAIFNLKYVKPPKLNMKKEMIFLRQTFTIAYNWDNTWNKYKSANFWEIKVSEIEVTVQNIYKMLSSSLKLLKDESWKMLEIRRDSLDAFKRVLPLINDLKNPAMRNRHWDEVREAMTKYFDETDPGFTLELIMQMQMQKYGNQISEISSKATMELNIENSIKSIAETWTNMDLNISYFGDEDIYRILVSDEILQMLEDHLAQLYSMKGSKYISIFFKDADYWSKGISLVTEVLEITLSVQRQFLYAMNIFKGDDIRTEIPKEADDFDLLTKEWKQITNKMFIDKNLFKATCSKPLLKQLNAMSARLEETQRALELYMETKRNIFPRFYFISNDDLLDILVHSNNPKHLQIHFKKCFDNINKLELTDNDTSAIGMYSADGEYVPFTSRVKCIGPVENWLSTVETIMRETLRHKLAIVLEALKKNLKTRDKWILKWPGQLCITASQIYWTAQCTLALLQSKNTGNSKPLKKLRKKQKKMLSKFSDAIRGDLTKIDRLKIVSLVTIEIHAKDVVDHMYTSRCMNVADFEWMSQLRFYWDKKDNELTIRQTNTEQQYGYEYLGNSGRLVITPLTDRCYITMTTALNLFRGGSPKGPAGTGKTETVKDLGKNLAYYVIVINCSDGLDYKSMGRMFSGLAQQGAWGCFDEFNRINIEVLSVVAQQILSIYSTLASRKHKFIFEGNLINLVHTCGIFITMNPGYAGRTELPDNLKSMFRAISMMVPDSKLIAEIMLFGEGFRETRILSNKVYILFVLCKQKLSKQDHYEFGLRGLVSLIRYAGQCRRQNPYMLDDEVLLLAMHNMNLAKLTVDDLPIFLGVVKDLFPSITLPEVKNDLLIRAIKQCMANKNHQPSEAAISKIIQLHETKVSRHSVMILGPTGAAKTATWKTLKEAMALLKTEKAESFVSVTEYPLNPKALTLGELYGEYNSSQEWMDGVLSFIMRTICSDTGIEQKWILFDGPVDALWIENMNSVMDDNKVLTLINSERITMPEQVSLLFEVEDLAAASPATVSRCGIVYNDYKDFGWNLYLKSWLTKFEYQPYKINVKKNFNKYVTAVLEFKQLNCVETVPLPELSSIVTLCTLLEYFTFNDLALKTPTGLKADDYDHLIKLWFLFCVVWSICAVVNEDGRKKIDTFFREKEVVFPISDTVYHYYVDTKTAQFYHWDNFLRDSSWIYKTELPFYKIIVPTIDTVRYNYLVEAFLSKKRPVLLVGPVGTGKTLTVKKALEVLDKNKFLNLTINMSARTTVHNVQENIEGRLEKRTKDTYVPLSNKTLVTFLDDMNMPEKETYGAQAPLELIRQWIDYEFWFDRQSRLLKYVKNMLLIAAMGPPGSGRSTISNRLLSCFSVINLTFPEEAQISNIYMSMLSQHLKSFVEHIRNLRNGLTNMTINLYKSVVANLLPTPAKMHYLFNLRDISKVFQGLLRSNTDCQTTDNSMLRLWCNEVFRVFNDKLIDEKDREWFMDQINIQLGKHYDMTYRSLCSSEQGLIFCDFLNKNLHYEEVTDEKYLREFIDEKINDYNLSFGVVPMNLVLFRDAIDHICRIVRVISQPRGYIMLVGIGGSGRSSLAKVANWLCDYKMFTIEINKSYAIGDFKEDLKHLYYQTGVRDVPTSFLFNDTQIVNEMFLEIINNILSTGEVPQLYKEEEFDEIKEQLSNAAKMEGVPETTDDIYSFFLDRVRSNLHIILCLSPIGIKFRTRLRQYPSLVNCTTIDWFLDWPKDALLEVALNSLTTLEVLATITGAPRVFDVNSISLSEIELKLRIANLFSIIHHSVGEYSRMMILELKRYNYVTPTNYLEFVTGYKETLRTKRIEIANKANKLRNGLFKIDDTSEKVAGMTVDLEKATKVVLAYTMECDEFLSFILKQTAKADQQKTEVDEKSIKIKEEEIVCQELYRLAMIDLEKALPALEEAMEALNALNKKDLAEVKSFSKPPHRVKLVLEAVMILKESEPSWTEAKRQLGDPNFLTQLKDFDKDHVSPKVLKKINTFTSNPEFEPDKVGAQSIAAKSLAQWVIAIEKYAIIYKIVAPKKESADAALSDLKQKENELLTAQQKLSEIQKLLLQLKTDFDKKMEEKEQLVKKADALKRNLDRAASLIEGLSDEKIRWTETVKQLDIHFDYLPGDCLLSIAFVSYMGPFVFKYRDILLKLWTTSLKDMKIPNNPAYDNKDFLSDPAIIRNWNIHGLPNDDLSTENGIIISRGSRWPLIIDPQCQALKWIKNMEEGNDLKIIDFCLPNYIYILEMALQNGNPTLLQLSSEHLDPSVMPVLSKSIIEKENQLYIKMGDKMLPYNDNFRFFITTKLRNPYYPPEIFTRTTVVNFAIKEEGLEDQLLDVVITMEKPELKILKDNLIINIDKGKKTLVELEDELLRLLNEIEGSLLENDELFQTLASSKIISVTINEQLETSFTTQIDIDVAREGYRACAKRASILFFVLNDLNQIDPMYQFSLDAYMDLFENSIRRSEKSESLLERLNNLNSYHTYAVYKNTCRGLFEVHKLLFSFQIIISLLMAEDLIPAYEMEFLLKGGIVVNKIEQAENPCPSWLSSSNWDNISELNKLPGFLGVEKSFEQFSREWKQWYMSSNPESTNLIGNWNDNTNSFQKMLFVRSLRLDRLSFAITNFIASKLGSKFIEPPVMDVKSALEDSSCKTPLIFLLSPGVDPTNTLIALASSNKMNYESLSLGQGQSLVATQLIEQGQQSGKWIFLANCHLSLSWMPQLDKIVDVMQDGKSHPEFRLWLSSNPNPDFPIALLQSSIKMTTEPPKGLKANMKRLYQNLTHEQFAKCKSQEKYKKLIFSLCFFHSILIERKKFQNLGWNVIYSFNDSDFEVSENLLSIYLDEYEETPWKALKYLIAGICYGGHVTDNMDRRLLDTYISQYFNEDAINTPHYKLSSLSSYFIPRDGDLQMYRSYIDTLPIVDRPEIFGQHGNAEMASFMGENRIICDALMILQGQSSTVTEENMEGKVLDLSTKILKKLPDLIDYASTAKNIKRNPLDIVLLQEVQRYNSLLSNIKISLIGLMKGIKGLTVMSSDFEKIFQCINEGRVPSQWLKTYPSLMSLGPWTQDLIERINHFKTWANKTHPPILFWLGAYTYPITFLTAVLQIHSRSSKIAIDLLSWEFIPIQPEKESLSPKEGAYVRDLYLEGADWNFKKSCLCESVPLKFISNLPVIHFKPTENTRIPKNFYQCPIYYYPLRCGDGRESFIIMMHLDSGTESPEYWIKRATAVLLSLSD
ncbi:dynein heavy chain 2, axonemal [Melanaphis sacchari]|uniref:dynein heavy chain 2, axonemal n=1 Tax=Melanaphis sacchari TaxID=742174 RepID=UPI000DC1370C|nr:dynein heavy chain 2, axonemal [Melanaphis sacchari]